MWEEETRTLEVPGSVATGAMGELIVAYASRGLAGGS